MTDPGRGGSFQTLSDFVSTAKQVVATGQNLDEANTKAKIVTPFIRTLGWNVPDNSEVLLEYSGEEQFDDRADYALFGPDGVHAVVEAKQIGQPLANNTAQVRRYMRLFGADWGLLTNGEEYIIHHATGENEETVADAVSLDRLANSPDIQSLTRKSAYAESA